jgi:hypothetical protein
MDSLVSTTKNIGVQFESQALNSVVAGFSFAAALAWMEVVRWSLSKVIDAPKNGASYVFLTAILTTLLSIVVYYILSRVSKRVVEPQPPVYAVTGVR